METPGGPILLALVGAGIIVAGIVALGVAGYVAKGVSIAVIGVMVGAAGLQNDPESAGTLDSAFKLLEDLPGGTVLAAAVGVGFIAYGVFCGFRAYYARLD